MEELAHWIGVALATPVADNVLHLLLAAAGLVAGLSSRDVTAPRTTARRA